MKNKVENAINKFLGTSEVDVLETEDTTKRNKKVVLDEREGLIERVDRIYVTNDGRQLLREQY